MLKEFWLFFSSITAIIKNIFIFFDFINNYKYIKVFKLLVHLNARAYTIVLPKGLHIYNLLLLKRSFYFRAMAFYKMSIEFPFRLL